MHSGCSQADPGSPPHRKHCVSAVSIVRLQCLRFMRVMFVLEGSRLEDLGLLEGVELLPLVETIVAGMLALGMTVLGGCRWRRNDSRLFGSFPGDGQRSGLPFFSKKPPPKKP